MTLKFNPFENDKPVQAPRTGKQYSHHRVFDEPSPTGSETASADFHGNKLTTGSNVTKVKPQEKTDRIALDKPDTKRTRNTSPKTQTGHTTGHSFGHKLDTNWTQNQDSRSLLVFSEAY